MEQHNNPSGEQRENTKFNPKFNIDDFINDSNKHKPEDEEPAKEAPNPFPVDAFPRAIQEIINATNECLSYPFDFIGTSMLYAASIALGNTYRVEVRNGWQESAVIFAANVGRPGTNKTHPLAFALQPIQRLQEQKYAEYLNNKKEYERLSKLTREQRQEMGEEDPVKPYFEKYTISDFTPEALAVVHKNNRRGLGVYVDELAGWFKSFNRYHKGPDAERWLSAWSCKPIDVDRVSGEPNLIVLPFISVGGNIQPSVLNELADNGRSQNGFIDRMLFAFPQGLQKPYWNEKEIQPAVIEQWNSILMKILSIEQRYNAYDNPEPEIIRFSPEAYAALSEWQRINTDLVNSAENDAVSGIYTKLEIYAIRLALIFEALAWASSGAEDPMQLVGLASVRSALQLIEYYRATAKKVHVIVSSNNPLDKLPENQRQFYEALPDKFTKEDAKTLARQLKIPEDTMNKWLSAFTGTLLKRIKKGHYEKLF